MKHSTSGPGPWRRVDASRLEAKGWRLDGLCVEGGERARLCLVRGEHRFVFHLLASGFALKAETEAGRRRSACWNSWRRG